MKKKLITILAFVSFSSVANSDPTFIDFAVQQAHDRGFRNCDKAIRDVHSNAGGADIRVNTSVFPNNQNVLTMISTWGSKGDTVFVKSTYIKDGSSCMVERTSVVQSTKSCISYAQDISAFKYVTELSDYIYMDNGQGVNVLLHPTGRGCTATFSYGSVY